MKHFNKLLIGLSVGIVVALMPSALFFEVVNLFKSSIPFSKEILFITATTQKLMGLIVGICIAHQFKFNAIQSSSLSMAIFVGSGAVKIIDNQLILATSGDVITMVITAIIAVGLLLLVKDKFKSYAIILIPALVTVIAGSIGLLCLPYTSQISIFVSQIIKSATTFQPLVMCILLSVLFSMIIVSPISSVAIALLASLQGIASGSANVGCAAAGIALAICATKSNGISVGLAHVVGSPKLQLANFLKKPIIILPVVCVAIINGINAYIFQVSGTALSAGFGVSGLVGPLNALSFYGYSVHSIMIIIFVYVITPVITSYFFIALFKKIQWIKDSDYKINY